MFAQCTVLPTDRHRLELITNSWFYFTAKPQLSWFFSACFVSLCLFWFVCRSYKSFSMASSTAFLASAYVNTLQRYDASHEFEMESAEGKKKYEWDGILKKLKDTLLPQLEKAKNLGTLCIFCKGSKEN